MTDQKENKEAIFQAIRDRLEASNDVKERFQIIKEELKIIQDPEVKIDVETLINIFIEFTNKREQIVIPLHGIRDYGEWQELLRQELDKYNIVTKPIGYGEYYDIFEFIFVRFTYKRQLEKICADIRTLQSDNILADITIVAHSFGTYLISLILTKHTDIRISRLILCGSIMPINFDWNNVSRLPKEMIVNDVGTKDFLPVLAKFINKRFGASGTFGFKTGRVTDRYHNFGHSDFFSIEFIQKHWVPLITSGTFTDSNWSAERKKPPYLITIVNKLRFKWIFVLTLLVIVFCIQL